jgi:antitoxin YefM
VRGNQIYARAYREALPRPNPDFCQRVRKVVRLDMITMNASEAREKLYRLLDETATDHQPVLITGPQSNAVLVGEEDWNAIQETLHLLSVPGMRESIVEGLATTLEDCGEEPGW